MKDKKDLILYILIGLVSVGLLTSLVYYGFNLFSESKIVVPDFKEMTLLEITSWAEEHEVEIEFINEHDEEVVENEVISQHPEAETKITKADKVIVTLSLGPEIVLVELPDFEGMTIVEIEQFVLENGMTEVSYEYEASMEVKENYFIRISTDKTEVAQNEVIVITISLGENEDAEIELADFSNYSKAQIDNWKVANKVKVTYKYQNSNTIAQGKVISQDPKAGTKVKINSTITVTLSYGPAISAKDFSGENKSAVEAWVKEYSGRFKVNYENRYSNTVAEGKVISNSPSSGTVSENSTVKVQISLGKPSISSYVGKTYSSFESAINSLNNSGANLKIVRSADAYSSTVASGSIISQSVTSGKIDVGSTITVVVSKGKEPVYVAMQSFAGQSETTFKNWISSKKLVLGTKTEQYHTSTAGLLISNSPSSGNVLEGTSVSYVVSLGTYAPPKFSGTYTEAKAAIDAANAKEAGGWSIVRQTAYDNSIAAGKLIPSKQTESGKTVTVYESLGKSVAVPNYVGRLMSSIGPSDSGLTVKFVAGSYGSEEYGKITAQSLTSGSTVAEGTVITLTYSLGSEDSANIKPYISLYNNAADPNNIKTIIEGELSAAGFTDFTVTIETDPNGTSRGVVFYQSHIGIYPLSTKIVIKISK